MWLKNIFKKFFHKNPKTFYIIGWTQINKNKSRSDHCMEIEKYFENKKELTEFLKNKFSLDKIEYIILPFAENTKYILINTNIYE